MEKLYNLYISRTLGPYNLWRINKAQLDKVLEAYHEGKSTYFLNGTKHWFEHLTMIQIFTVDRPDISREQLEEFCNKERLIESEFGYRVFKPECLAQIGTNVTEQFIGDSEFGDNSISKTKDSENGDFVDLNRINELETIKSPDFDLTKLIQLCREINMNYSAGNYLSVGMIGRTIIHHVPPIFGFQKFAQVESSYGDPRTNKSFKKSMQNLSSSLKNIADRILHQTIRKSETLPTLSQVNFSQDLDVLLEEIVRKLK